MLSLNDIKKPHIRKLVPEQTSELSQNEIDELTKAVKA